MRSFLVRSSSSQILSFRYSFQQFFLQNNRLPPPSWEILDPPMVYRGFQSQVASSHLRALSPTYDGFLGIHAWCYSSSSLPTYFSKSKIHLETRKHSSRMRSARFCGSAGRGVGGYGLGVHCGKALQTHVKIFNSRNFVCGQ